MHNKRVKVVNKISKLVNSEGIVILKNKNNLLPLTSQKINLFGRIQFNYYKSGTGSGGLVNTPYVYSLFDILNSSPRVKLNPELVKKYEEFIKLNPFNNGNGTWASEPWSQVEMEISLEDAKKAKEFSDIAVIIIGRTAGEDKDFTNSRGSYQLSLTELNMIKNVTSVFDKVILILNVGTIIDINEVVADVEAIMLAYHGGYYGAISIYEALIGLTMPSGQLPFTILKDITKDPTITSFGQVKTPYLEDIYVGYRYHHTFNPNNILYPLGYGLGYGDFKIDDVKTTIKGTKIDVSLDFINKIDRYNNKTIFFYVEAPNGFLGKPKYELVHFYKPNRFKDKIRINQSFDLKDIASFDDLGVISKGSYVLEKGDYLLHLGFYLGDIKHTFKFNLKDNIISKPKTLISINEPFKRIVNKNNKLSYEAVEVSSSEIKVNTINKAKYEPNNYTFDDLLQGKITSRELVRGLTNENLTHLVKGEGMSSPKTTPGIAAASGGITKELEDKKIPIIGFSDGPSGIRMDSGFLASSIPNGALIASSFNLELIEKLFTGVAMEMKNYNIDILLGPGVNIHRNVLNGRNFEYFSEDPVITGLIAASILKGLHNEGRDGSLKHFTCNNQESYRFTNEVVVSNRALREIYMKGYELAIREGNAKVIMSSYNYVNGYHALTHPLFYNNILREEFGFNGIMISDWWAHVNKTSEPLCKKRLSEMIKANQDLYMVVIDATIYDDDLLESLNNQTLSRDQLEKVVANILDYYAFLKNKQQELNKSKKAITKELEQEEKKTEETLVKHGTIGFLVEEKENGETHFIHIIKPIDKEKDINILDDLKVIKISPIPGKEVELDHDFDTKRDMLVHYQVKIDEPGNYVFLFEMENHSSSLSQTSFNMYFNEIYDKTYTYNKFDGVLETRLVKNLDRGIHTFSIKFNHAGLYFKSIKVFRHP